MAGIHFGREELFCPLPISVLSSCLLMLISLCGTQTQAFQLCLMAAVCQWNCPSAGRRSFCCHQKVLIQTYKILLCHVWVPNKRQKHQNTAGQYRKEKTVLQLENKKLTSCPPTHSHPPFSRSACSSYTASRLVKDYLFNLSAAAKTSGGVWGFGALIYRSEAVELLSNEIKCDKKDLIFLV